MSVYSGSLGSPMTALSSAAASILPVVARAWAERFPSRVKFDPYPNHPISGFSGKQKR